MVITAPKREYPLLLVIWYVHQMLAQISTSISITNASKALKIEARLVESPERYNKIFPGWIMIPITMYVIMIMQFTRIVFVRLLNFDIYLTSQYLPGRLAAYFLCGIDNYPISCLSYPLQDGKDNIHLRYFQKPGEK